MFTALNGRLSALRNRVSQGEKGFTLIELLIVVLIIGVLAAIAIPIFFNVQATARENTAKTTVTDAKTAIVATYTSTGVLPEADDDDHPPADVFAPSDDVTLVYIPGSGQAFCVSAQYGDSKIFKATNTSATDESATACASAAG